MFSRVWPGAAPALEQAFENFRYVAQDLQLTLEQYPHEGLRESGWVAPQRFYNDAGWAQKIGDHARLDDMYEWYSFLLEDLAIELTRAANLVCEAVRQTIDPRYRLEEGLVVLEFWTVYGSHDEIAPAPISRRGRLGTISRPA